MTLLELPKITEGKAQMSKNLSLVAYFVVDKNRSRSWPRRVSS